MKRFTLPLIFFGILFTLFSPVLFIQKWTNIDFTNTGQIGDTIGGITAPVIGILSILLLYYTLWEQICFNKKQKEISIDEQFKSTFFNLLQVQRDILGKISGKFSYLGVCTYEEYPQYNKDIIIEKEHKTWATIKNMKDVDDIIYGIEFFKEAKYQLKLIYDVLDSDIYYCKYDSRQAYEDEVETQSTIYRGLNIPREIEDEQNERIFSMRRPYQLAYTSDKYNITEKIYKKYKDLPLEKKIGLGYAYFFNKYENVGYYFRHLYRILKFINMNEEDKLSKLNLRDKEYKKEKQQIYEQYKQYAQFIQAQMSTDELLLLFYNSFAFPKAQNLIIHYGLLENLTIQNLINKMHNCVSELNLKDKTNLFLDLIKK